MEFTGVPRPQAERRARSRRISWRRWCPMRCARRRRPVPAKRRKPRRSDVTMRIEEGHAVLRQPDRLHRQHDDARQRDPPRDAAGRRRRLQHRGAEVQRPPPEPARLLQAARRQREGHEGRQDARPPNNVDVTREARGAEPQPADLRRRRLAVRGRVRPARVPDVELPRPRREPDRVDDGRRPVAELPAGVHRAVPVRPQHHRRLRHLQAVAAVHRLLHAEVHRRQPRRSASRWPTSAACSSTTRTRRSGWPTSTRR